MEEYKLTHMLFKLLHQSVLFALERHHFLLHLLFVGGGKLQQGDVGVLLTDGGEKSLLPAQTKGQGLAWQRSRNKHKKIKRTFALHVQDLLQLFASLLSQIGQVIISLSERLLRGRQTLLCGVKFLPRLLQYAHQVLHL